MSAPRALLVVGARPNYMKAAPLLEVARRTGALEVVLVHTGQHFDPELSSLLMDELGMPKPDHHLAVGRSSPLQQLGTIATELETVCLEQRPAVVIVVGDVNSTLGGALVANKLRIPLVHVEAGLRSRDPEMPEEWNRRATDLFSDLLFCTERSGVEALLSEGKAPERIFLVGNAMIDTLLRLRPRAARNDVRARLGLPDNFAVVTLHRPSNVDDPEKLRSLFEAALLPLAERLTLVFPVHPRTRSGVERILGGRPPRGLVLTPPLGYLDFLSLVMSSRVVITDSGGVQEETTVLGVPCLTVRENTERPITVEVGTNRLVGTIPLAVLQGATAILDGGAKKGGCPPLWDGRAAERMVAILGGFLAGGESAALRRARDVGALVGRDALASGRSELVP